MDNKKLITILKDLGLSDKEARVYFSALSLGPSSLQRIAIAAELKRTTVYSTIATLQQKGIVNIEMRGFKRLFVAENPERLASVLEQKREEFKKVIPEFLALYNLQGGEGLIKYYEGLEGVKSLYEGLIKDVRPHEDYLVIGNIERWLQLDRDFFLDFLRRRAKLNIKIRLLLQDTPAAREHKKMERNFNETIKILPPKTSLTTNLVVIPRRVMIHQLIPPILGIVIENRSVIQMHREMFEIMWKSIPE